MGKGLVVGKPWVCRGGGAKGVLALFPRLAPPLGLSGHPGGLPGGGVPSLTPMPSLSEHLWLRTGWLSLQGLPVQVVPGSPRLECWEGMEGPNPRMQEERGSTGAQSGQKTLGALGLSPGRSGRNSRGSCLSWATWSLFQLQNRGETHIQGDVQDRDRPGVEVLPRALGG